MDYNSLLHFVKVAEFESFTKTAKYLNLSKSQISRSIAELENSLGVQLFLRTTRKIELTHAGKLFFKKTHPLINQIQEVSLEVGNVSQKISGWIKLTLPEDIALRFNREISEEFIEQYPNVKIEFYVTGRMVDLYKEPIDLGIRFGKLNDSSLKAKKIGDLKSVLVCSPQILKKYDIKQVEDLIHIPIVGFGEYGKVKDWILIHGKKEDQYKISPKFLTNNMEVLLKLILNHKGVGLVPEFLAREMISQGQLVQVLNQYHTKSIPMNIVWVNQKELPKKLRLYIDFLYKKLSVILNIT